MRFVVSQMLGATVTAAAHDSAWQGWGHEARARPTTKPCGPSRTTTTVADYHNPYPLAGGRPERTQA